MRRGKVESRATHARSGADSLQYVQTSARLGQRGRFLQMSWSTSADHAHFWRIGAVRLHALIRNMSARGHDIQPPGSEPRILMWRALGPHGQHTVPRLLVRNSLHNDIHHQETMLSPSTHVDLRALARCAQPQRAQQLHSRPRVEVAHHDGTLQMYSVTAVSRNVQSGYMLHPRRTRSLR